MSARSADIRRLPCLLCEIEGVRQPNRTTEHHCNEQELAGHKRVGDHASIPACEWHHQGYCVDGMDVDEMTHIYGPSLKHNQKQFRYAYGRDEQLIELTNMKLARLEPATA